MNVALYCRNIKQEDIPILQKLLDLLASRKIGVFIYKSFFESVWQKIKTRSGVSTFESHEDIRDKVDYMFSLGGDGTLLDTLTFVRHHPILIMGINPKGIKYLDLIAQRTGWQPADVRQIGELAQSVYTPFELPPGFESLRLGNGALV